MAKELTQAERDRQALLKVLPPLGAAAADVVSLPARGVMGAYNTAVRPLRAAGVPLPQIEFAGSESGSMTPFYDAFVRQNELPLPAAGRGSAGVIRSAAAAPVPAPAAPQETTPAAGVKRADAPGRSGAGVVASSPASAGPSLLPQEFRVPQLTLGEDAVQIIRGSNNEPYYQTFGPGLDKLYATPEGDYSNFSRADRLALQGFGSVEDASRLRQQEVASNASIEGHRLSAGATLSAARVQNQRPVVIPGGQRTELDDFGQVRGVTNAPSFVYDPASSSFVNVPDAPKATPQYQVGKIYPGKGGARARYLGSGRWEEIK